MKNLLHTGCNPPKVQQPCPPTGWDEVVRSRSALSPGVLSVERLPIHRRIFMHKYAEPVNAPVGAAHRSRQAVHPENALTCGNKGAGHPLPPLGQIIAGGLEIFCVHA